jgi:hypothetical protein
MLTWEDDDLGVWNEAKSLKYVFSDRYNFAVETFLIPSSRPDRSLKRRIIDFIDDNDNINHLFVVYYFGHAFDARRNDSEGYRLVRSVQVEQPPNV